MEDNEKYNYKYKSLGPSSNAQDIEVYRPVIDEILCNEKDYINKNIAITGGYGAGKSSIINTYFKNNDEVLFVSLASYVESQDESDKSEGKDKLEEKIDNIETSILQQILYSVRPSKLPLSRINRIDKNYLLCTIINSILTFVITIIITFIFILLNHNKIVSLIKSTSNLIIPSICFLGLSIILYSLLSKISNYNFRKVSINGVELEKEEGSISVLNRNVDELIHFFDMTKYSIVVFEDIDRLQNNRKIFSKLKEINSILNNSINKKSRKNKFFKKFIKKNKVIKFIYAINDTVFNSAEERTKFFDGIVNIIPYSGIKNSRDIFYKEKNFNFDSEIVKVICDYVENSRVALDIINEYSIYDSNYNNNNNSNDNSIVKSDKNTLLVLSAYKVLYPKKYNLLLQEKGKVAYYLTNDFKEYASKQLNKEDKDNYDVLMNQKKATSDYNIKFKDILLKMLKDNIINKINDEYATKPINIYLKNENQPLCDINCITENEENLNIIVENEISFKTINNYNKVYNITEADAFDFIPKKSFIDLIRYSNSFYDLKDLYEEINIIKERITMFNINNISNKKLVELLDKMNIADLPKKFNISDRKKEILELNEFEKWILENNKINSTFRRLVIKNQGFTFTENDNIFINIVKNGENNNQNIKINNPKNILDEISEYDFSKDSICNKDLLAIVFKENNKYSNHLNHFFNNMSRIKYRIIIDMDKDNFLILNKAKKYFSQIIEYVKENEKKDSYYERLVCRIVNIGSSSKLERDFVIDYFENVSDVEKIFKNNLSLIEKKIEEYEISFKQDNFSSHYTNKKFYEYIVENNLLCLNNALIASTASILKYNYSSDNILESIYSNEKENALVKLFNKNINDTLNMIDRLKLPQHDSEEFISNFIKENELSEEIIEKFIKFESIKFKDISNIAHYNLLKREDKIYINWNNLNILFEYNENEIDEYIVNAVNSNIDNLLNEKVVHDDYRKMFEKLHKSPKITFETFKKIIDNIFINSWHYNSYFDDMNIERNYYLIENNKMYTQKDFRNIDNIIENSEIDDKHKLKFIENSFKYLKKISYAEMSTTTLNYIVRIEYNMQELVDYVYKYEELFDKSTYNELFKICINHDIKLTGEKIYNIIINSNKDNNSILKIYNNHSNELSNYTESILNKLGGVYASIISDDKTMKRLDYSIENYELLQKLEEDSEKRYFDHFDKIGNKLLIYYNPRRRRKNN